MSRFLNHKYDAYKELTWASLDILTRQLLSLTASGTEVHCSTPRDILEQETFTCWGTQESQTAKTQPDQCSLTEISAKLLGPTKYTDALFFPSIIALQFYLSCISCSQDCKTTKGKEKGILSLLTEKHIVSMEAITSLHWSYSHGKSYTGNKAGIARILRTFQRHLHGFKEDTICATQQSYICKPVRSLEKTCCERTREWHTSKQWAQENKHQPFMYVRNIMFWNI